MELRQECWEKLKSKYEDKNRTLQQKELELRHRLEAMEAIIGKSHIVPVEAPPAALPPPEAPPVAPPPAQPPEIPQINPFADFKSCTCTPPQEKAGFFKCVMSMFGSSKPKSPAATPQEIPTKEDKPSISAKETYDKKPSIISNQGNNYPAVINNNMYKNENCICNPCILSDPPTKSLLGSQNSTQGSCGCNPSTFDDPATKSLSGSQNSKGASCICNPCMFDDTTTKSVLGSQNGKGGNGLAKSNNKNGDLCTCSVLGDSNSIKSSSVKSEKNVPPPSNEVKTESETKSCRAFSDASLKTMDLLYMKSIQNLATEQKSLANKVVGLEAKAKIYESVFNEYKDIDFTKNQKCICNTNQNAPEDPNVKTNAELKLENFLLKNELKDMRLEVRQYIERMEGPMLYKIESERYKCFQLEQKLEQATKELVNTIEMYDKEINSLKMLLCNANSNVYNLQNSNDQLQEALQFAQVKITQLEDNLIRQKISEAETIKSLQAALEARNNAEAVKEECNLHNIARELSKILKECEPCGECMALPEDLTTAAKLLKSLTDMIDSKLPKDQDGKGDTGEKIDIIQKGEIQKDEIPEDVFQDDDVCQEDVIQQDNVVVDQFLGIVVVQEAIGPSTAEVSEHMSISIPETEKTSVGSKKTSSGTPTPKSGSIIKASSEKRLSLEESAPKALSNELQIENKTSISVKDIGSRKSGDEVQSGGRTSVSSRKSVELSQSSSKKSGVGSQSAGRTSVGSRKSADLSQTGSKKSGDGASDGGRTSVSSRKSAELPQSGSKKSGDEIQTGAVGSRKSIELSQSGSKKSGVGSQSGRQGGGRSSISSKKSGTGSQGDDKASVTKSDKDRSSLKDTIEEEPEEVKEPEIQKKTVPELYNDIDEGSKICCKCAKSKTVNQIWPQPEQKLSTPVTTEEIPSSTAPGRKRKCCQCGLKRKKSAGDGEGQTDPNLVSSTPSKKTCKCGQKPVKTDEVVEAPVPEAKPKRSFCKCGRKKSTDAEQKPVDETIQKSTALTVQSEPKPTEVDQIWPTNSERFKLSHQVVASKSQELLKSETSIKCLKVKENFPFDVDTQVDIINKKPDGVHVTTTITNSGTLEVITEGPEGVVETTLIYTNSGNVEVVTEITEYESKGKSCNRNRIQTPALPAAEKNLQAIEGGLRSSLSEPGKKKSSCKDVRINAPQSGTALSSPSPNAPNAPQIESGLSNPPPDSLSNGTTCQCSPCIKDEAQAESVPKQEEIAAPLENVPKDSPETPPQEVTETVTESPAENSPENPADSSPENPADSSPENPAESSPENPTENLPENQAEGAVQPVKSSTSDKVVKSLSLSLHVDNKPEDQVLAIKSSMESTEDESDVPKDNAESS